MTEAQAQLDRFGASIDATAASAESASPAIDSIGASAGTAATSLDATATSADAAATGLDAVGTAGDKAAAGLDATTASADAANASLTETSAASDAAAGSAAGVGVGATAGSIGLLALGAGGLFATKHAYDASTAFNTYMQDLVSISPALQQSTDLQNQMAQAILNTSVATGMGYNDVARAMYYAVSGSKTLADAQALVNEGSKLGVIGMTNSTDATKLLTGTMNAYGLTVAALPRLNDEFTKSISNGVLRLSDLNSVLPQINTQAAEMGISLPTILGGLDEMTNKGLTSFQAATEMKNLIIGFDKPTTGGKELFASMGFSSGVDMVQQLGFQGAIQAIYAKIGNDPAAIAKVFPDIRKLQGFLALGSNAQDWQNLATADQNSTGEADKSLAAQEQATSFHVAQMKAAFNDLAIAMGNGIRPIVQTVADVFAKLFETLAKIPGPILGIAGAALALVSGFTFLFAGGELLAELFGGALGAALEGVATAFGALLIPLAAVAAGVYLLYEAFQHNFLGIKDDVLNAFNAITAAVESGISSFQFFTELGFNPVAAALAGLSAALTSLGAGGIAGFVNQAAFAFQSLWDGAMKLWDGLGKVFDGGTRFSSILKELPGWMQPVALGLIDLTSGIGKLVNGFTDGGLQGAMAAWPDAWRQISHGIDFATQAIEGWLQAAATAASGTIAHLADWTLDVAMPKIAGWLSIFGHDAWIALQAAAGYYGNLAGSILDWTLNVAMPNVTGWLVILGDDAWTALKATVGYAGHILADAGAWTLNVAMPAITGWLSVFGNDAWTALKAAVGYVGHVAADAGSWTLNVAMPNITGWLSILGNDAWTALKAAARFTGGLIADLGEWTLNVGVPTVAYAAGVSLAAIATAIHDKITPMTVDLGTWTLSIGAPTISFASGFGLGALARGIYETIKTAVVDWSGWKLILGEPLIQLGFIFAPFVAAWLAVKMGPVNLLKWTLNLGAQFAVGFVEGAHLEGTIEKALDAMKIAANLAQWTLDLAKPAIPALDGLFGAVNITLWLIESLPGVKPAVTLVNWILNVNKPDLPDLNFVNLALWLAESMPGGKPAATLVSWIINLNPPDFPDITFANIALWLADAVVLAATLGTVGVNDQGLTWNISLPIPDFPDLSLDHLKKWIEDKVAGLGDISVTVPNPIHMLFSGLGSSGGGDNSIGKAGAGDSSGGVGGAAGMGGGGSHRGPLFGGLGGGDNLGGLSDLGSKLSTFFANVKIAPPDLSPVTKAFETAQNAIAEKMGAWVANIGALATGAGRLFNVNLYAGLLAGQTSAQGTFNQIGNDAGVFVANLGALATGAGRLFNTSLYAGMLAGQQSAQGVFNAIGNAAGQFVANVAALASFAGSQFNLGLSNGLGSAYASALYFMGQIKGVLNLGSEYGVGYGIGSSLGQGLNDGIASWTGAIQATAASAVALAVLAAKQAGGIASPSREMMYVGDMLGYGAHLGLSNWITPMGQAGAALTGSAVTGARSNAFAGGVGAGTTINQTVNIKIDGAQSPQAVGDAVVNAVSLAFGKARNMQVGLLGVNG